MANAFKELPAEEWLTSVKFMAYYFNLKNINIDPLLRKFTLKFWATNDKANVAFEFLGYSDISLAMQNASSTQLSSLKRVSPEIEKRLMLCWFEKMCLTEGGNSVQIKVTDGYNHHSITVQDSDEVFFHDQDDENDLWPSDAMW